MKKPKYKKKKWLIKQYCDKGRSALTIAKKCGVHKSAIYYWLKKFGVTIRSSGESRLGRKFRRSKRKKLNHITRKALIQEYVNGGDSMKVIAKKYGCSENYIRNQLIRYEIEIREQYGRNIPLYQKSASWFYKKSHEAYEEFWGESIHRGYRLHHVDRNPRNIEPSNLSSVTCSFHKITHNKDTKHKQKEDQAVIPMEAQVEIPVETQEPAQVAA